MKVTTVRLPEELDERLSDFCSERGAVKSRVVAIALRAYLGDQTPALSVQPPDEPDPKERDEEVVRAVEDVFPGGSWEGLTGD